MDKVKFELEFLVNASDKIIYNFISTPDGLSEWFADNVNIRNNILTFIWEGSEEQAKILTRKKDQYVKYKWLSTDDDDSFFEIRIKIDELTGEIALIVTDFSEEDELEESKLLWESQIGELKHTLGA